MEKQPVLKTNGLILRPFSLSDARDVQRLAGDRAIAETTIMIPHPFEDGDAEKWIETHEPTFQQGKVVTFAITLAENDKLVGAMGLDISKENNRAELGYWVGKPFWGKGYCTEAARRVIQYGFEELGLNRIFAHFMTKNPASGRVMEKAGMKYEGYWRQHVKKWDVYEDLKIYSILKSEFDRNL